MTLPASAPFDWLLHGHVDGHVDAYVTTRLTVADLSGNTPAINNYSLWSPLH